MQDPPAQAKSPEIARASSDLVKGPFGLCIAQQPLAGISDDIGVMAEERLFAGLTLQEVTQARKKISRGEPVTDREREGVRAYYAQYTPGKISIHLKGERRTAWEGLAHRQGLSMSLWVQERVTEALAGPSEAERLLHDENGRLRDEIAGLRGTSGYLAVENSKLQSRIEALEQSLMDAMEQALRLEADDGLG